VRFCTDNRQPLFSDNSAVEQALSQFRRAAAEQQFAILAYCFMCDHVHLVVRGLYDIADLRVFASRAKQYSGYAYAQKHGKRLWQRYFYEHTLRSEELPEELICYVLMNPVRAGRCVAPEDYPFSGSEIFTWDQLREFFRNWDSAKFG
jgi:REP-associated tyrosine transposase